jgi:FkbM family methyltransferase
VVGTSAGPRKCQRTRGAPEPIGESGSCLKPSLDSLSRNQLATIREHTFLTDPLDGEALVVDLGANRGEFSRDVSRRFGARCLAVEASRELAGTITESGSVCARHLAVGGNDGTVEFHVSDRCDSSSLYGVIAGNRLRVERVQQVTLDTLLAELGPVALVKVDIEGAERELFQAASDETIRRVAQFTIEFHDLAGLLSTDDVARIVRRLRRLGFFGVKFTRTNYNWLFFQPERCSVSRIEALALRYITRNSLYVTRNVRRLATRGSAGR